MIDIKLNGKLNVCIKGNLSYEFEELGQLINNLSNYCNIKIDDLFTSNSINKDPESYIFNFDLTEIPEEPAEQYDDTYHTPDYNYLQQLIDSISERKPTGWEERVNAYKYFQTHNDETIQMADGNYINRKGEILIYG